VIETARLRLRPWREADKPAFHRLVNTPAMTAYFGGPTDQARHDRILDQQIAQQARFGHCMWAVELRDTGVLAGICGLRIGGHPGTPVPEELEIGWRIGEAFWRRGIAREAARASLAWGWANTARPRIAAWTSAANLPSRALMAALGMTARPELDFHHPDYAPSDPAGAMLVHAIDRPAGSR
jgi:RimJ/RimL family protein N-acetyltransferase